MTDIPVSAIRQYIEAVIFEASTLEVLNTLEKGDYDLIHFCSHGQYERKNSLFSFIELENGAKIRPCDISGKYTAFGQANPLIILNSCESGVQGFSLTGIQSWATRFINAGTSGRAVRAARNFSCSR
jgi:CHAT domain-containing protein